MHLAILGVTGAVGRTMLAVLDGCGVPVERLTAIASEHSAGTMLTWRGDRIRVVGAGAGCFDGVDFALFSAGAERSRECAPLAVAAGALVIDNSSAWRTDPDVPLVVPEINAAALAHRPRGIIANPNCSTIQLVMALEPLRRLAGLRRVVVTTFQSASGAGEVGREALRRELSGSAKSGPPFGRAIAGNVIPCIGDFDAAGWAGEERKMMFEAGKILSATGLQLAATCVRVPVDIGHSIQAAVELDRGVTREEARLALAAFPGICVAESDADFPTPLEVAGSDQIFVGRLRRDPDLENVLHLWIVADNLRKGAATNAVQILERVAMGTR